MRILHIIPTLGCGGAEILLGNMVMEQVARRYIVEIVILEDLHPTYSNYFLKDLLEKAVEITQIDISISFVKNKIEMNIRQFDEIVQRFKPNVIHSHLFKAELISRYKIYKHIKYVTHCHNNMNQFDFFEKKTFKRRITDFLETKWLLKKYKESNTVFIAISKDTEKYFVKQLPGRLKKNVYLLSNSINTAYFFSNKNKRSGIKLISVGNLTENKGHSFLIDVVYQLKIQGYTVSLMILGYGPLKDNLQNQINSLGLSDSVFLKGNVSNVNEYFSESDIYLHAAHKEGFGLVLVEAMASELPVITTDGGGNKDLIQNCYNGYLIQNRNSDDFTDKIKYLIDNSDIRISMGENALLYSKSFDIVPYVDQLSALYRK